MAEATAAACELLSLLAWWDRHPRGGSNADPAAKPTQIFRADHDMMCYSPKYANTRDVLIARVMADCGLYMSLVVQWVVRRCHHGSFGGFTCLSRMPPLLIVPHGEHGWIGIEIAAEKDWSHKTLCAYFACILPSNGIRTARASPRKENSSRREIVRWVHPPRVSSEFPTSMVHIFSVLPWPSCRLLL